MNRAFSPLKSVFAALLMIASTAYAAQAADPAKGEALYVNGNASRNITACVSCHGAAGNSTITQNPKIAGQHDAYLVKQLKEFQSGARKSVIMAPIMKQMTEAEMNDIAAYLAKQVQKPGKARGNEESVKLGQAIYRGGIAEKRVPACAACHSPTGAGLPAQYPRVGGQHADYTVAELERFRSGERANGVMMHAIADRMSDREIKAVSDYIAGLATADKK